MGTHKIIIDVLASIGERTAREAVAADLSVMGERPSRFHYTSPEVTYAANQLVDAGVIRERDNGMYAAASEYIAVDIKEWANTLTGVWS